MFFEKINSKHQIVICGEYNIVALRHLTQENGKTSKIRGRPTISPSSLDFCANYTLCAILDRTVPIVNIRNRKYFTYSYVIHVSSR